MELAIGEFQAALKLAPGDSRAGIRLRQISLNQNVLGMARDHDLLPDFPRYEEVVTDYRDAVFAIFHMTLQILEQSHDLLH